MELTLATQHWGQRGGRIVLLHGFTGAAESWRELAPALAETSRLTAVDLPGHGRSPLPSPGEHGFEETLSAIAALLDARTDLIGYSMGARLALAVALERPGKVRRLVLESGSPGLALPSERAARRATDEARAESLLRHGVEAFVRDWEELPLFEGLRRAAAPLQASVRERRRANRAEGLAASLRASGTGVQPSYWEWLGELKVPTLLITGANDERFTGIAERMAPLLPNATHLALPGVWHVPHLEAPRAYVSAVLPFLQSP